MIRLTSSPKTYATDQDKTVPPSTTVEQVRAKLKTLPLSILGETRRIDTGRLGIPVFLSTCGSDAKEVMPTRKQMGKGASAEQAEASALMELMERYGFFTFWQRLPDAVHATWDEAESRFGDTLMPLTEIIKACHDSISLENARKIMNVRRWVFIPATRIVDGKTIHVPLDLFKQLGEFNGSSAGNTDVESLLQGACELVERHTCGLIDQKEPEVPTIDCTNACTESPVLKSLLEKFAQNGVELILKDFSLGMPVPTVAALAYDPTTFPATSEIVFTAGTASSPAKAAIRAITEVAQLAGDFTTSACYEASGLPKYERFEEIDWLRKGSVAPLESLPSVEADDILDELQAMATGLHKQGFTLYSVATTNPDTEVPTHYSFVPGFAFRERDKNASLGLFVGRMITEEASVEHAETAYALLETIYPNAHFLPFFKGMLAMRMGDNAAARDWFTLAEPLQPEFDSAALTAFYLGYTYTLDQDWKEALPGLQRAAILCPDMKEYLNLLGVCLFKLKLYDKAAKFFSQILTRLDKGSIMDLQNLGLCHKFMGNDDEACHYLTAALELDPTLEAAQKHLKELCAQMATK